MAHFTIPIDPVGGALLQAGVGVSVPRGQALTAAGQQVPALVPIRAMIDTGASHTSVDPSVLQQLGIPPTGSVGMHTASSGNTPHQVSQYDISLLIPPAGPNHMPLVLPILTVTNCALSQLGFQALIGRDILQNCVLVWNGSLGFFTLAF